MVGNNNPTAIADAAAMFRIVSDAAAILRIGSGVVATALSLLFGSFVAYTKEGACRDEDDVIDDTEN